MLSQAPYRCATKTDDTRCVRKLSIRATVSLLAQGGPPSSRLMTDSLQERKRSEGRANLCSQCFRSQGGPPSARLMTDTLQVRKRCEGQARLCCQGLRSQGGPPSARLMTDPLTWGANTAPVQSIHTLRGEAPSRSAIVKSPYKGEHIAKGEVPRRSAAIVSYDRPLYRGRKHCTCAVNPHSQGRSPKAIRRDRKL